MKTLILLLSALLFSPNSEVKDPGCVEIDIIMLIDISGSISGYEYYIQEATRTFVDGLDFADDGIMMSVITFSTNAKNIVPLTSDKLLLKRECMYIYSDEGSTDITKGLHLAFSQLIENGRAGVKKLIIVLSDGAVDKESEAREVVNQLDIMGIGICGALILSNTADKQFMKDISKGCYVEASYENLVKEIKKLDVCM